MPYKNPEDAKEWCKNYYIKNKEKITEKRNEYVEKNITICVCGATVQKHHLTRHLQTKKHLSFVSPSPPKEKYNQRPDVVEKKILSNKRLHICECGGYFTTNHKKQHCEGKIHKDYLNTGIKYELPENQKNKLYYDERLMEIHKKYFPEEK